jgi:hypothetical protein
MLSQYCLCKDLNSSNEITRDIIGANTFYSFKDALQFFLEKISFVNEYDHWGAT